MEKGEVILPSYSTDNGLANKFGDFFKMKALGVRDTIITDRG